MKVEVNFDENKPANGVAALALVVALLDALQSSGTVAAPKIADIVAKAKTLISEDRAIEQSGRRILDSIEI